MSLDDLKTLAAYLDGYEEPTLEGNVGLYARQNMVVDAQPRGEVARVSARQAGLTDGLSALPVTWFSLALAQRAVATKQDNTLPDVSGGKVVLLGTPRVVGGKSLRPGDQFFFQPLTKSIEAIKPFAQLKQEAQGPQAGPGNVFETAPNLRAILRSLGSQVLSSGPADPELVREWQRIATANNLNPSVNAKTGDWKLAVSAPTVSMLRVRARNVGRTPAPAATAHQPQMPVKSAPSGTRPTAAPKPGMTVALVSELQSILKGIGYSKLAQDGKWGPNTQKAWQTATVRRNLDATIGRASASEAWVVPATLAAMRTTTSIPTGAFTKRPSSKPASVPAPIAAPVPAHNVAGGSIFSRSPTAVAVLPTADVQAVLVKLGEPRQGLTDGKYGKLTFGAYARQAIKLGKDPLIEGVAGDPRKVGVFKETWAALLTASNAVANAAKPDPAKPVKPNGKVKPDQPSKTGMVKANVGALQDALRTLGAKLKRDGLWGTDTQRAWQAVAKARKLDGALDRAGPMEAWAMPETLKVLTGTASKPVKPDTKPDTKPDVKPQPDESKAVVLVVVPLATVNEIRITFGEPAPAKPSDIVVTWNKLAKKFKLDGTSTVQGAEFRAVAKTYQRLLAEATLLQNVRKLLGAATAGVTVSSLQKAIAVANVTGDFKGKFPQVKVTGTFDSPTFAGMLVLFRVPLAEVPVWNAARPKLVDKTNMKLLPAMADVVKGLAAQYEKNKAAIAAEKAKQEKVATREAKLLEKAVGAANSTVSVFVLQQAVNEVRARQLDGTLKGSKTITQVGLTGKWDAATASALYATFAEMMWPEKRIEKSTWSALLGRLLSTTTPQSIALPAGVVDKIKNMASKWVKRTGGGSKDPSKPVISTPSGGGSTSGGSTSGGGAAPVINVNVQNETQVPSISTPDGPTPGGGSSGGSSGGGSGGEPTPAPGPGPGPDAGPVPAPPPDAQPAPSASSGALPLVLLGGGLLAALMMGSKKPKPATPPARR